MALVGTEVRNQFIEGNIAIASMDAKSGTVLTDAGVNWDFIPSLEDETRATWIASDALIMNSASQNKELAASMARTVLDKMPQEKKDELLVQLLNRNRDKLLEKGRTLAAEKGVRLQLCDVSARKF